MGGRGGRHLHLSARRIPAMPRDPRRASSRRSSRPGWRPMPTSICAAVRAPISAARNRRCSNRSKASAVCRGSGRRFRAQVGLFGRPTLCNNVETLYWVRDIVEKGADWFTGQGRNGRKGLRTFSVSGRVRDPGVKLAPAGITARQLIDEFCGGMAEGHVFKGYLPGGASGGILPAAMADIPLDFGTLEPVWLLYRLGCGRRAFRQGRHEGGGAEPVALFRGRELRPMHAVPRRHRKGGQADDGAALGRRRCCRS